MWQRLGEVGIGFLRANLLGFGGGPAIIPLIEAEAVDRYRWMSEQDFVTLVAVANTLPGPIATKLAGYLGYRVAGPAGATVALLATVVPTAVVLIALFMVLDRLRTFPVVNGMIRGVTPVVWVLFLLLLIDYTPQVRSLRSAAIAVAALVAALLLRPHPAWLVLGGLVAGGIFLK